jgi:hypothetical protein
MRLTELEIDAVAHDVHDRCASRLVLLQRMLASRVTPAPASPRRGLRAWVARAWGRATPALRRARLESELQDAHRRAIDLRLRAERAAMEVAVIREERAVIEAALRDTPEADGLRRSDAALREMEGLFVDLETALTALAADASGEVAAVERAAGERAAAASRADLADHARRAQGVARIDLTDQVGPLLDPARVDRLRASLDLWGAGAGAAWRAAEAEVNHALADVVERWRRRGDGG